MQESATGLTMRVMAQGRLLAASDVGGHGELLRDGETGVPFRPGDPEALVDAVTQLLPAPEPWPAPKARRRFVENERNWAANVGRYGEVYARLIEQPDSGMNLLTVGTLYPNAARPAHGIFVETRLRHRRGGVSSSALRR